MHYCAHRATAGQIRVSQVVAAAAAATDGTRLGIGSLGTPCQPSRREIPKAASMTASATSGNRSAGSRKLGPDALTDATT